MAIFDKNSLVSLSGIPILESTDQWIGWDREIQDYLAINGYSTLLKRNTSPPTQKIEEAIDDFEDRMEVWEEKQARACAAIRNRLGYNGRELVKGLTRVHEILLQVKKNFRPTGSAVFQDMVKRLEALS